MWVCLNDAFLSIVKKDCARDELLVRARRKGDIERIFPSAKVTVLAKADYRYRAVIKTKAVAEAMVGEVSRIAYGNFKSSVKDGRLHDAYMNVWQDMMTLQGPKPPKALGFFDPQHKINAKQRRKKTRSAKKKIPASQHFVEDDEYMGHPID